MDSTSVIKTYLKCLHLRPQEWTSQRDKDIWMALRIEKRYWKQRVQLFHVESHVDRKKDEHGNKRIPTSIQKMNIYADDLADKAYTAPSIGALQTLLLPKEKRWQLTLGKQVLTGNTRTQLGEEIRIQNTKTLTPDGSLYTGLCPEEIEYRYMRKTSGCKTLYERVKNIKLMQGKRATKDLLVKFQVMEDSTCEMCGTHKETNRHAVCFCTNPGYKFRGSEHVDSSPH